MTMQADLAKSTRTLGPEFAHRCSSSPKLPCPIRQCDGKQTIGVPPAKFVKSAIDRWYPVFTSLAANLLAKDDPYV